MAFLQPRPSKSYTLQLRRWERTKWRTARKGSPFRRGKDGTPLIVNAVSEGSPQAAARIRSRGGEFRVLEHDNATRERFVSEAAAASFLVICSELTLRENNPMLSGFRLADGWITAMELYSMTCQSNAVALDGVQKVKRNNGSANDLLPIP